MNELFKNMSFKQLNKEMTVGYYLIKIRQTTVFIHVHESALNSTLTYLYARPRSAQHRPKEHSVLGEQDTEILRRRGGTYTTPTC